MLLTEGFKYGSYFSAYSCHFTRHHTFHLIAQSNTSPWKANSVVYFNLETIWSSVALIGWLQWHSVAYRGREEEAVPLTVGKLGNWWGNVEKSKRIFILCLQMSINMLSEHFPQPQTPSNTKLYQTTINKTPTLANWMPKSKYLQHCNIHHLNTIIPHQTTIIYHISTIVHHLNTNIHCINTNIYYLNAII